MANAWYKSTWIRRTGAVVIAALLPIPLGVALALFVACGSVMRDDYLADRLEDSSAYDTLTTEVLPAALNDLAGMEFEQTSDLFDANPLVELGVNNDDLVAWAIAMAPRDWFDAALRQASLEVWSYMVGGADEFSVTLRSPVNDALLASETAALMRQTDLYDYAVEKLMAPAVNDFLASETLPFTGSVRPARVESAVRDVVSEDWFYARAEEAVYTVAPWIVGRESGFDFRIDLAELGPAATEEYRLLLREAGAHESLYDQIVSPGAKSTLGEATELAPGVPIYLDDVVTAIRDAGEGQWASREVDRAIDEIGAYLYGASDGISFVVSLEEIGDEVTGHLEDVAHARVLTAGSGTTDARTLAARADAIVARVGTVVVAPLLGELTFTEHDLRAALSPDDRELLDDARAYVRDGFLYTDADMREDIRENLEDPQAVEDAIDTARSLLSDGWTFTHHNLVDGTVEAVITPSDVRLLRRSLGQARVASWIAPLVFALGIVGFVFLLRAQWRFRIAFASFVALLSSLAACALFTAIYFATGASYEVSRADALRQHDVDSNFPTAQSALDVWQLDLARDVVGDYTSAVAIVAAVSTALALLALVVALRWEWLARRLSR